MRDKLHRGRLALGVQVGLWLAPLVPPGQEPIPPEDFVLEGVVCSEVSERSVALVRRKGARWAASVRVGESVFGMKLVQVELGSAVFERGGERVRLSTAIGPASLPERPPAAPAVAAALDRAEVQSRLQREMPLILAEGRLTPRVEAGEVRGYQITRLPAGTILSELGLAAGDVLLSINDEPVAGWTGSWESYLDLLKQPEIRLVVERQGRTLRLLYPFR